MRVVTPPTAAASEACGRSSRQVKPGFVDMGVTVQHTGQHNPAASSSSRAGSVPSSEIAADFPVPDVQMPAENPIGGDQHSVPDR